MTHDIHTLVLWIRVVAVITSICTTSLPLVYLTFPWRTRKIGRLMMLQAVAFAVTIDLSTLFSFWTPKDILVVFWIDAVILTAVGVASAALTWFMLRLKFPSKKGKTNEQQGLQRP